MVTSGIKGKKRVLEYAIEAVSEDLIDCRLQVVPINSSKAKWYQERILSDQDEIVDNLIDARDGRILWTLHRPVRGWYLHIQLPSLPREMGVPLQPVRSSQAGCTTPLSICIGTRIDFDAYKKVDELIPQASTSAIKTAHHSIPAQEDGHFTALPLDTQESLSERTEIRSHARTSSRTLNQGQGHVRRRSGVPSTCLTPSIRHVSRSSQNGSLREDVEEGIGKTEQNNTSQPRMCNFLLTDDAPIRHYLESESWKSWAWNRIPETIRIPLRLDTFKVFSILWTDAPPLHGSNHQSVIEIVRFEDDASWLNWKGRRKGKILVQEEAIKALGLDLGFWIAVSVQS